MSKYQTEQKQKDFNLTPINYISKPIENTGVTKVMFFSVLKTQQNQSQDNNLSPHQTIRPNKNHHKQLTNHNQTHKTSKLMQSHYSSQQSHPQQQQQQQQKQKLKQKISFLQHCMNEYKLQALKMYSKLTERENYYKQGKEKYDIQIAELKQQISSMQKQIQGQSRLIEQCHQKYDLQVKQHQLCLTVINQQKLLIQDMNLQINSLQRAVTSTRQVSVNLIKQNQNLKAQLIIEKQKYQMLLQDYNHVMMDNQRVIKEMYEENRVLIRKLDEMDVQLKIFQKDKEIEELLSYEDNIHKRQREMFNLDQKDSISFSPSDVKIVSNKDHSPYQYLPRKLNFEQDNSAKSNKKRIQQNDHNQQHQAQNQIIELQKSKIAHLQNQLKQFQKRNKELQGLIVKFMK